MSYNKPIHRIAIVGTGVIGASWAAQYLARGFDVVATDPGTRMVSRKMMEEAEKIARRIGVHFRVNIERRIDGAAAVGAHRTSMLQDLDKRRPLELDALLTVVQELGRLVNVDTPIIDAILALAQQMGRVAGVYPTFPEPRIGEDPELTTMD